jgi:hypothetical protein
MFPPCSWLEPSRARINCVLANAVNHLTRGATRARAVALPRPSGPPAPALAHVLEVRPALARDEHEQAVAFADDRAAARWDRVGAAIDDRDQRVHGSVGSTPAPLRFASPPADLRGLPIPRRQKRFLLLGLTRRNLPASSNFGVELCPEQDRDVRQPEPDEEDHDGT